GAGREQAPIKEHVKPADPCREIRPDGPGGGPANLLSRKPEVAEHGGASRFGGAGNDEVSGGVQHAIDVQLQAVLPREEIRRRGDEARALLVAIPGGGVARELL